MRLVIGWCLALASAAAGVEIDVAPDGMRIPPGATREVNFGTVPQQDTTVLLEIQTRMDSPTFGGSNWFMHLTLNGRPILPAKSRTVQRLQNKPLVSPVAPNMPGEWYGGSGWRVLYAPDFQGARASTFYVGDPYTLVLDITDLTNPAAENRLEITSTAAPSLATRLNATLDLVVNRLRVTTRDGASPTMVADDAVQHLINRGEPSAPPAAYQGEVLPGGAIAVTLGGRRLVVRSSSSYPNAGHNLLGEQAAAAGSQQGWVASLSRRQEGCDVRAEGPDYRLQRTVTFTPRRIDVADTFTNKHADAKLGLLVRHDLGLEAVTSPKLRLAGNGDPAMNQYHAPANASVHIGLGNEGLGLIAQDDVFRNQATLFYDPETKSAGLFTNMLCLQPGGSYTLRWSIYPVASPEYYDFINLVRQDWGSNYTTEGAWIFFGPDEILDTPLADLRAQLDRLGVNRACSWGGWVDFKADRKRIGFGTEVCSDYWADYRHRLKEATAKLHEARPGIKVLIYYDTQRDTYADAGSRYPDSKLTNLRGEHLSTDWSKVYSLTWSMVATADNSFGKALLETVDCYMDEIGADGVYWDEMEGVGYGAPLLTYDQPDGFSCILDPKTYTVQREVGNTILLGEGHRLAVIDKVRAKGGTLMGNGPSGTRALLERQVQRMVEIQHNEYWSYQGHLGSPLGYGSGRMDFGNVVRGLQLGCFLVGTRRTYEHDISKHLFPFTPIELHYGYLLGRERIVTLHSGAYGWVGETVPCTVRIYDKDGKERQVSEAVAAPNQKVKVDLQPGEVAVIVRR
ncbi:MAG: hypothetical protein HUU35_01235 [Armatimonadetes bacterium]|nr:hypothetical protein [Armatimonadota bacterium]